MHKNYHMKKEDIYKIVKNPKMIEGIYNYCDRWCERCEYTKRCANFFLNENHLSAMDELDINNKRFWEKLHEVFQLTLEMVKEIAEEQGIDLESIDYESSKKADKELNQKAKNFECSYMSNVYIELVDSWFDSSENIFDELVEELKMRDELGLPNSDSVREVDNLYDVIEVIRWYQHQIHVKILRAVTGKLEDNNIVDDNYTKDSDGSAKVALIGIDRSIASWGEMLSYLPNHEDGLINILVHLERLRRKTEAEFPNARAFIRVGFDEI
jgi:hypothetical protein